MDLTGTALKMQNVQSSSPGGQTSQTTISIPPPAEFARSLTEALTTSLVATGKFIVLERLALAQVQQEQDLGGSGRVNTETAAEKGKLMGAQVLITGDITQFAYQSSAIGGKLSNIVKGLDAGVERVSASVSIDLRLIDAVTGEVIASIKGDGSAAQQGVTTHLTRDEKKYDGSISMTTPLGKASREAIQKSIAGILDNVPKLKWSARVIDFRAGVVYVNAGAELGMVKGMALEVFDPQPTLIDPETGRNLGAPDKLVGEVVIDGVEPQYSTATVVSGTAFKRNQVVRIKGQGAKP
jgi:curli biogenesis system outer membrane secretion channel CsgG